ncbi:MAG: CRTAC1 family protein [Gammaproteobacteria bacterium]|nr:CRTAC1 family protein [Gammaproteobacteria bacterium]
MKIQRRVIDWLGPPALLSNALAPIYAAPATNAGQSAYFSEISAAVGIDFRHFNGMSGEYYLMEIMGSGAALFDYDNDGDLDAYLVQGAMLGPGKRVADALSPPQSGQPLTDRLLRNDLTVGEDGSRILRFTDVTAESGIDTVAYGMGVATGDVDNDGWVDLYVTNYGNNQLLRNNGDGTFSDITRKAGVGDPLWSVSASFVDIDRDGLLDLFVGNYVHVEMNRHAPCRAPNSAVDYCTPLAYPAQPDRLYRNTGDNRFQDISRQAGITSEQGAALGVTTADLNGDLWPDLYVANDASANHLWINTKEGSFRNDAFFAGAAVNMQGAPEGSMGVDAADFDGDGDPDLFVTHLTRETNTIYVNDGRGWFEDRTITMGLAGPSKAYTGFGTAWFDLDNDGWLDIFAGNGAVSLISAASGSSGPLPLQQPNQLFLSRAGKRFEDISARGGAAFELSEITRGAAFGDVDNDGDTDILVTNNNGRARLLLNDMGHRSNWLGLRLVDGSGRDALGARVRVQPTGGSPIWRRVRTDGSYASANDPRVLVGLGAFRGTASVRVHWPDGNAEEWRDLPANRYFRLRQGTAPRRR